MKKKREKSVNKTTDKFSRFPQFEQLLGLSIEEITRHERGIVSNICRVEDNTDPFEEEIAGYFVVDLAAE